MKKAKIQIFKAGRYGESESRIWSVEEVQSLVDNYDPSYRNAPVILGHNDWNGEKPAYGWVESLSIDDKGILHADIEYNDELGEMVSKKMYTRVSIEATKKIELHDTLEGKQGAYILAVSLLGGSQPAVSGLQPVAFSAKEKHEVEAFETQIDTFELDETHKDNKDNKDNKDMNVEKRDVTDAHFSDTITNEVDKDSTKNKKEEYEVTTEEKEAFDARQTKLTEEQEAFNVEKKTLADEKEAFALVGKKALISAFTESNKKRIVPAVAKKMESFMIGLNDEQMESFKEIITSIPENEIFKNMDEEKNENNNINTDAKFQAQAQADLALAKK